MRKRKRHAAQNLIEARIAQLQKNAPKPAAPLAQRDPNRPLWLPDGLDYERVPLEVRQAAAEIIQPAYEEMVRDAKTGMEKSLGASIVHLLWLEVLDQFDIKQDYVTTVLTLGMGSDRQTALNQYIRLLDAKLRVGNFLLRLRELRLRERKFEQSTPHTEQSTPHTPCAAMPLQPGSPLPEPASLSCKNEDLPTKKETADSHPAAETWKNNQKAPKNPSSESAPQAPSPKTEDHSCKTEDLMTKKEPTDLPPSAPTWKNENLPTKNQSPEKVPQDPSPKTQVPRPKTQDQIWKNNQCAPKTEPEEFEDLEGKQMYANYLALFPEAASAPIIPDPRKKQGPKPSPYYSPK